MKTYTYGTEVGADQMSKQSAFQYDLDAYEWHASCGACAADIYSPTKDDLRNNYRRHTRSTDCLGGY